MQVTGEDDDDDPSFLTGSFKSPFSSRLDDGLFTSVALLTNPDWWTWTEQKTNQLLGKLLNVFTRSYPGKDVPGLSFNFVDDDLEKDELYDNDRRSTIPFRQSTALLFRFC